MVTRGNVLEAFGIAFLEVFEVISSIVITMQYPNGLGSLAVFGVVLLTAILNTWSTDNPFIQEHKKVFDWVFTISTAISIIALLFILFMVSPLHQTS